MQKHFPPGVAFTRKPVFAFSGIFGTKILEIQQYPTKFVEYCKNTMRFNTSHTINNAFSRMRGCCCCMPPAYII